MRSATLPLLAVGLSTQSAGEYYPQSQAVEAVAVPALIDYNYAVLDFFGGSLRFDTDGDGSFEPEHTMQATDFIHIFENESLPIMSVDAVAVYSDSDTGCNVLNYSDLSQSSDISEAMIIALNPETLARVCADTRSVVAENIAQQRRRYALSQNSERFNPLSEVAKHPWRTAGFVLAALGIGGVLAGVVSGIPGQRQPGSLKKS